ncbi:MAG TPA: NAD(P)/FAD-dependent oxidoreductase [Nitrospiraceae bacterium]|nr:NAD(P)/FAD-dependent oxidoreductase [Nitrospiraceae bacterium]
MTQHPQVVIVGAGFGGLRAARALKRGDVRITVIDRRNYHLFQPLLYQVATAGLSPNDIAYPIRAALRRQKNTRVFLAEVVAIDTKRRKVILQDGEMEYDYLILATGAGHSYFGHTEWEAYAPSLKSIEDALEIRRRILLAFEMAERETVEEQRRALLTFVVIGGGPTGVELAGAIAEIAYTVMVQDFRSIRPQEAHIILVEAGTRILPFMPESLSLKAEAALKRLGVEVVKNSPVTSVYQGMIMAGSQTIHASTVLWAAGVAPSPLARSLAVPLDDVGRVQVNPDLSIPGHPEVFVIGDLAAFVDETGKLLPGLAAVAVQEGKHAAHNILRMCNRLPSEPFHYVDMGTMATIGRAAAVVNFNWVMLSGFVAWVIWIFVHILLLIGFRNRLVVLFDWAWSYLSFQRSARLITGGREK